MDATVISTTTDASAHITTGAVIVYAIEWAKRSHLVPFLDQHSSAANKAVAVVCAAAAAVGIGWTMSAPAGAEAGTYVITITGLTLSSVAAGFWEVLKQFMVQQLIYDGVVAPKQKPAE